MFCGGIILRRGRSVQQGRASLRAVANAIVSSPLAPLVEILHRFGGGNSFAAGKFAAGLRGGPCGESDDFLDVPRGEQPEDVRGVEDVTRPGAVDDRSLERRLEELNLR